MLLQRAELKTVTNRVRKVRLRIPEWILELIDLESKIARAIKELTFIDIVKEGVGDESNSKNSALQLSSALC